MIAEAQNDYPSAGITAVADASVQQYVLVLWESGTLLG